MNNDDRHSDPDDEPLAERRRAENRDIYILVAVASLVAVALFAYFAFR